MTSVTRDFQPKDGLENQIFMEEDNLGVQFQHNNAVVVTLNVENYDVCLILTDNGSLAKVLYYDAFVKMGISPHRLGRVDSPSIGFTGMQSK